MQKKTLKLFIKIAISALCVAFLYFKIDKERFVNGLLSVPISVIISATIFFSITQALSATKWWVLVRNAGIDASLPRAVKAFFIGMFINTVGVGTVGGDIVRALLIDKQGSRKGACLATVVADRAIGLSVLASIGVISGCIFGSITKEPKYACLALIFIVLAVLGFYYVRDVLHFLGKIVPKLANYLDHIAEAFPRGKGVFFKVILIAVLYHLSQIFLAYYIIIELGAEPPLSYVLFAVPFINFLTTLPLSWMGLGLRESIYALFFVPDYFESPEKAILIGTIWLIATIVASAVGGVIAFITGDLATIKDKE